MSEEDLASIDGDLSIRRGLRASVATWPRRTVLGAALLAPVAVALGGGFSEAVDREQPTVEPGESVDLGPYTIALEEFFVASELEGVYQSAGVVGFLGLVATVEGNERHKSDYDAHFIRLPEGTGVLQETGLGAVEIRRLADNSLAHHVEADMPMRVALLYELGSTDAIGDALDLQLIRAERLYSVVLLGYRWYAREPIGTVRLPRAELPPPILRPEEET